MNCVDGALGADKTITAGKSRLVITLCDRDRGTETDIELSLGLDEYEGYYTG